MSRFRMFGLLAIVLLLSVVLVACGDPAAVPTYPGATSVTVPSTFNSFTQSSSVKNATVTAYTTSDSVDKVKSGLGDAFKKNGWDDKNSDKSVTDLNTQLSGSAAGSSVLGYQSSDTAAIVMIFPSSFATPLGFTGAADNGSVYVVMSGKNS